MTAHRIADEHADQMTTLETEAMALLNRNPTLQADFDLLLEKAARAESRAAADRARRLGGQLFGKRISTIHDYASEHEPWLAVWDDWKAGDISARGANEAQAIRRLVERTREMRDAEVAA